MKQKEKKLIIAKVEKMFDIEALIKKEPDLFDDLCKDYPLKDTMYLVEVEK